MESPPRFGKFASMKLILEKSSTKMGLISILIIQIIVGGFLGISIAKLSSVTNGYGILDFEVGYSIEKVNELFSRYEIEGMILYKQILFIDLFNPLIYSLLFSSLLYVFYKESKYAWLVYLGFLCAGLDYLENFFLFEMMNSYPDISSGVVEFSSAISIVKHSVLYLTILILVLGMVRWVRHKRK